METNAWNHFSRNYIMFQMLLTGGSIRDWFYSPRIFVQKNNYSRLWLVFKPNNYTRQPMVQCLKRGNFSHGANITILYLFWNASSLVFNGFLNRIIIHGKQCSHIWKMETLVIEQNITILQCTCTCKLGYKKKRWYFSLTLIMSYWTYLIRLILS